MSKQACPPNVLGNSSGGGAPSGEIGGSGFDARVIYVVSFFAAFTPGADIVVATLSLGGVFFAAATAAAAGRLELPLSF